jgi:uncharacterized membrane protein YgdD (TMEM256/DUF423 family)
MQRRDVLRGAAALGVQALGAGAGGCAAQSSYVQEPGIPPPNMSDFLARVDEHMEGLASARFVQGFVEAWHRQPVSPEKRPEIEARDALFRKMLRSLYFTQTFRDLPEDSQLHPEMQDRMRQHIDEVDVTVSEVTGMLAQLDDSQREAARRTLKQRPALAMKIAEVIDEQAALAGVSRKRRVQLRGMMAHTSFRLKNAAPGVLIDEYLEKVQRVQAQSGAQAEFALRIASQAGSDAFWQQPNQAAAGTPAGAPAYVAPTAAPPAQNPTPGIGTVKAGGLLLGIGVATFAGSAVFVALGADLFVIGMTVGAILFAVGLVMLIVGAIIYAASA